MTPAAWAFLAALTAVGALSVWVDTWRCDVDGCGHEALDQREGR